MGSSKPSSRPVEAGCHFRCQTVTSQGKAAFCYLDDDMWLLLDKPLRNLEDSANQPTCERADGSSIQPTKRRTQCEQQASLPATPFLKSSTYTDVDAMSHAKARRPRRDYQHRAAGSSGGVLPAAASGRTLSFS